MRKAVCTLVLAAMLSGTGAGAWDSSVVTMSRWAEAGIAAAYESGAVSDDFDLGTDYTRPITRAQMARLTVDLVLDEQQTTLPALAGELGIQLEMAPLSPAEEAAEAETDAESVPAASDSDEAHPKSR